MKLRERDDILVLGVFLGVVAMIAALVLASVSKWTEKPIAEAVENNRIKAFHRLLLPEFDTIGDAIEYDGVTFYPVSKNGAVTGFVGQSSGAGYGGNIELLVGFLPDGKITSVQILRHKETPGLGANVCERKFQRTIFNLNETPPDVPENRFLDQYRNKSAKDAGNWQISKDGGEFDYMTGATVTSRSVTALVNEISGKFADFRMAQKAEVEK